MQNKNEIEPDYESKPVSGSPPPSQETGVEETNAPIIDTFETTK